MTKACTFYYTVLTVLCLSESATRTYYIGIRELYWNYAPSERNLISGHDIRHDEYASTYLLNCAKRTGIVYKKAVYKQYTDNTFTNEERKLDMLGFLGPVIRAEVGDEIVVHLRNFASRPYSIHPHGVLYKKNSEGAWYPDGTSGGNKSDDAVAPGHTYTYTWIVTENFAPTEKDSDCLTSMYHSHVNAPKDIAAGLIGVLLICKKGALDQSGHQQSGVSHEFLMFSAVDENLSWYLEENIKEFCPEPENITGDEDFQNSNRVHSINGFVYGNLPELRVCLGRPVFWHLFGIGNDIELHSVHFHGHTLLNQGHRTDALNVFPATSFTAKMVPNTNGKWLFGCQVGDYMHAGMQGLYEVSSCENDPAPTVQSGHIRRYYIAAEEILWNYAPSGKNILTNKPLNEENSDSNEFFSTEDGKLGGKYWKIRYTGYHDDTFKSKINQSGSDDHLGILGPVIRGEPGDVIEVTFRNLGRRNFSMKPHGVSYDKAYEGMKYQDVNTFKALIDLKKALYDLLLLIPKQTQLTQRTLTSSGSQKAGASVAPGHTFTYRWRVTEGPSPSDPPCLSYLYYSATDPVNDTNSGLVGPLQVCKKGVLDESGRQHIGSEVQKEFFLLFSVMDENKSWYLQKNIEEFGGDESDKDDVLFQESNKMHSVNGFMYGNIPDLYLFEGDHVVWHLMALGSVDLFAIYFQGNTFKLDNTTHNTLSLFPHSSVTVSMTPDNNGLFELSSLIPYHYRAGMRQLYTVKRSTPSQNPDPEATTFKPDVYFYIASEEVEWNYAPNRTWESEKFNTTLSNSPGSVYLNKSKNRIGPVYRKVVYRKYTDETFTKQDARGPDEEHLGILGPILRVQVGEKVQVVFKNKAKRNYSVHAHGVKSNTAQPVSPGNTARYNWTISSGPEPNESNCTIYPYYSSVNFLKDLASGLVGPLVVCRKGTLNSTRQRSDVEKEFALLFMVFDENESWYLEENINTYLGNNTVDKNEPRFLESNLMHGINGKLYANLNGLRMRQGDRTEWYLMGLGSEEDVHTIHFHDQSFIYKTDQPHRADVYGLFPGTFKTVQLRAGTPGTWLLHCHVSDHIDSGMETTFTVYNKAWTNGFVFLQWFSRIMPAIILTYWLQ
ncbi:ferroxidase HEPHL1-like isoform X2 [Tachysurus vachellii]|uniref:ferroxidase HEPHL1-like isoform X2 n=1 Tax=Tachysurus vachellii TaxID=175792 RepID=UPI00296AA512|nr:ferroxidase HEPHL1-like isoform X2 [Tachysurus vachellii]